MCPDFLDSINARTEVFGIFGFPVRHSLSPRLHNRVFRERLLHAVYTAFEVRPEFLGNAVEALRALGIRGVNVTVPHKEGAAALVDEFPRDLDRGIGAVNTLVLRDGKICGFNTDGPGFVEDARERLGFEPKNRTVLLVGAGGAARAVSFALLEAGLANLLIYNRTLERARGLVEYVSKFFPKARVRALRSAEEAAGKGTDLLVQASSCGMKSGDSLPVPPGVLRSAGAVYDLVYAPPRTRLLEEARRLKIRHAGGIGMLVRQAALTHCIWFPDAPFAKVVRWMENEVDRGSRIADRGFRKKNR